jgi:hypothetical protein
LILKDFFENNCVHFYDANFNTKQIKNTSKRPLTKPVNQLSMLPISNSNEFLTSV